MPLPASSKVYGPSTLAKLIREKLEKTPSMAALVVFYAPCGTERHRAIIEPELFLPRGVLKPHMRKNFTFWMLDAPYVEVILLNRPA